MSKNPRMQIMSSGGSGRAQFLIFLCRGVTRSVNIFRVNIKTLKMIFWSCFWASGLSKYWSSCRGASFDGFVHYESRFCHFTETCGSYPAHDVFNFHDVCKDRVVYPYFMPILILSVVFGSLRHLLVIISPYSMSTVIYSHYINLSIFGPVKKVINLMFH